MPGGGNSDTDKNPMLGQKPGKISSAILRLLQDDVPPDLCYHLQSWVGWMDSWLPLDCLIAGAELEWMEADI